MTPDRTGRHHDHMKRLRVVDEAKRILGGRCVRCGITNPLDLDHVADNGHEHRCTGRGNMDCWWSVIEETDGGAHQLLCTNCNALKQRDPDEYAKPPTYGPLPDAPQKTAHVERTYEGNPNPHAIVDTLERQTTWIPITAAELAAGSARVLDRTANTQVGCSHDRHPRNRRPRPRRPAGA
jgi:hypothetical protein